MKFDGLSLDCLESVIECLPLTELLNVADSTKRLRKAAQLVYDRKYGKKILQFEHIRISPYRLIRITDRVRILDFKTALQLLRCVGQHVTRLHMYFPRVQPNEIAIERELKIGGQLFKHINDYCAEFLEQIWIYSSPTYPTNFMDHFDKPFVKLRSFEHCDYNFTENGRLDRLFPNLEEIISLHKDNVSFFSVNTIHFPHLEQFAVSERGFDETALRNEMVTAVVQLNPQITMFTCIAHNFRVSKLNIDLVRHAVDSLQNVVFLNLQINPRSFMEAMAHCSDNTIRMKRVKYLEIRFRPLEELPECFLPFAFKRLSRFYIYFPNEEFLPSLHEELFNFFEKHQKLSYLRIENIHSGSVDWSRLATSLPLLAQTQFDCFFSVDEVIELIPKFRNVKTFNCKLDGDYNSLRQRLGCDWEGTYDMANKLVKLVKLRSRY